MIPRTPYREAKEPKVDLGIHAPALGGRGATPDPGNAGVGRGNKLSVLPFYPGEQMV